MKRTLISISFAALSVALPTTVLAGPKGHTDVAKVTNVEPIYDSIQHRIPQESCWIETVREERPQHRRGSAAPTIIGGIIGGVIGNEVGRGGDNKKIGSVVGSMLGMSIAKDIQRRHQRDNGSYEVNYRDVERCETTYKVQNEQVLQGYNVSYRYHGREYSTFMQEHPGDKIRVAVNVRPVTF